MKKIFVSMLLFSGMALASDTSLLDQLKALVEINSGSNNQAGVLKIQNYVVAELKKLGFETTLDQHNLVIGEFKAKQKQTLTLIMHADTVFEPFHPFQHMRISEDGKKAFGPGAIDDKAGILVALEGLRRFFADGKKPSFSIRVLSAPAEETGSTDSKDKFREFAKDSWITLGFEPGLDDGAVVESRRGNRWYHIKVVGKEAHAGRAHKEGINACNELASKLAAVSQLTNYDQGVTVSIGHMEGGKDKYNIVCGTAEGKIDVRFSDIPSRDAIHKKIVAILNKVIVKGAKTTFELDDDCPPFAKSKIGQPYLTRYLNIIEKIEGRKVGSEKSGGAADANYFGSATSIVIDGLGAFGGDIHTSNEFVDVASIETRAEAFKQFLTSLVADQK